MINIMTSLEDYSELVHELQQECRKKDELISTLSTSFSQITSAMSDLNSVLNKASVVNNSVSSEIYGDEIRTPKSLNEGIILKVKKVREDAEIPQYQTEGSSGMDLCAAIDNTVIIPPLQRVFIHTGIAIELPLGYEAQVRPRSGLSSKHGITLVNCVGTIDSDYRGEIIVPLINLSDTAYSIQPGERIAQMVISKYERVGISQVSELSSTERGAGGFGSTGVV